MFAAYYHATLLSDRLRVAAYRRALEEVVRPGNVVVDLGAGSGILSLLAVQAGAQRVYAIERGPIAELGRAVIAGSPYGKRVKMIRGEIGQVELPERADVAVTETIGNQALDENITQIIHIACSRYLKPEAQIIPLALHMDACAVTLPDRLFSRLCTFEVEGIDVSVVQDAAKDCALFLRYDELGPQAQLSQPRPIWQSTVREAAPVLSTAKLVIERDGRVDGIAMPVRMQLSSNVVLQPCLGQESHWLCTVLPIRSSLEVQAGDTLTINLLMGEQNIQGWRVRWHRQDRALGLYQHALAFADLRLGLLGDPGRVVPQPSVRQRFALGVLRQVDGKHTCEEIAQGLEPKDVPPSQQSSLAKTVLELLQRVGVNSA